VNKVSFVFLLGLVCCFAAAARAEGPHDMQCMDCHTTHYAKGNYAIGVQPKVTMNPARTRTGVDIEALDALCLGCHNEAKGIRPIEMHTTHPTSVRPVYAKVPSRLLWDGKMTCVSCHNPHPANGNHMYLVVQTNKGNDMGVFCAVCHPDQASPESVKKAQSVLLKADPAQPPVVPVPVKTPKPAAPAKQ